MFAGVAGATRRMGFVQTRRVAVLSTLLRSPKAQRTFQLTPATRLWLISTPRDTSASRCLTLFASCLSYVIFQGGY